METLYYHDVVIQSSEQKLRIMYDLKMTLGAKSGLNQCKVDTGTDGNLLPINVYIRLVGNFREFTRTVDKYIRLVAYNNTEIKQYVVCYIMVQFERTTTEAKFFVVDQMTTLIGLSDSIKLGLITVDCFDSMKQVS